MNPLVSTIIPSYKRPASFVKRAIDSALNQTYPNIEIVVVDDNPPDSPAREELGALLETYKDDPRVRAVINAENMGGSEARNEGVKAAKGEYLAFLDDDDEFLPNKIEAQLKLMLENDLEMTFSDYMLVDDSGRVMDYRDFPDIPGFDRESLFKYHMLRHMTATTTFMYRAEALKRIGGFQRAATGQEFYLMMRTIEQGLRIGYLPGQYSTAHYHDQGRISSGPGKVKGENALHEYKKSFFHRLTPKERRFVRFRHYAVLTMVHLRDRKPLPLLCSASMMCLTSPGDVLREGIRFLKGRVAHKT